MTETLYGLQRRGQWLTAPANPPTFGAEPIWAAPTLQQALEKAQLIKSVEPRRIP